MERNDRDVVRDIRRAIRGDRQSPWLGIAFGAVIGVALVAVLAKCQPEQGPAENLEGEVSAVEVVVSKYGHVSLRVRANTPDGVRVVALPAEAVCWPGDRIELRKRGAVYQPGAGDCSPGRRRRATPHPSGSA